MRPVTGMATFFANVTSIGGSLSFSSDNGNPGFTSFSMLGNLESIGTTFSMTNNNTPTSFDGLSKLASIGANNSVGYTGYAMNLYQADSSGGVTNYCGLTSLTSFNGQWRQHNQNVIADPVATIPLPTGPCN